MAVRALILLASTVVAAFATIAPAVAEPAAPPAPIIPPPVQPANIGDLIFLITGPPESQRAATERNLRAVGCTGYPQLIMEPTSAQYVSAADFKAPQRAPIEQQGDTIIANLGDQPSDLDGGFSKQTYLLPKPFYRIP